MTNSTKCADATEQARIAAERQCDTIRDYWFDRGYLVNIKPRQMVFSQKAKCCPFALESDMINGLPRNWGRANA